MADEEKKEEEKVSVPNSQPADAAATDDVAVKLESCQKERDEYLNGWKRAKADLINYQKDETKRLAQFLENASADLIGDFLPVLDSLELALASSPESESSHRGLSVIFSQLLEVLKNRGLERIMVKPGDAFDARLHEALGEVELKADDPQTKELAGKIVEELSPGYTLDGRIIRASKVKIGK